MTHLAEKNSQPRAKITAIFGYHENIFIVLSKKHFENICFALSIKIMLFYLKATHCQGKNWSSFIHKLYKEKSIKRKIVNFQMRKKESTGWKVSRQLFNVLEFSVCASFSYTQNWNWLQCISLEKLGFKVYCY